MQQKKTFFFSTFGEIILLWKRSKKHPLIFFFPHIDRTFPPSIIYVFFSFWQCSCIYSGSPTRTWSLSCPTKGKLLTSSELHVSGLSRGSNHYNSIHAKNLELDWVVGTTPTTQSSLLVGTIPTSTSLSLKYKFAGIGMTENWHHKTCMALTEQSRIATQKELHIKHCEHRLYISKLLL